MIRGDHFPVDYFSCDVASQRLFAGLSSEAMRDLANIQSVADYPGGALLFEEGEPSQGIYLLCSGGVKLSICSSKGQSLVLRMARPGDIIGLSATVSGKPHEVKAETTSASQLFFIRRKEFLRYLKEHTDACLQVVQFLSNDVHAAYDRVRALGMLRLRQTRN